MHRHTADDPAVATILTTAHRPESCPLTVRDDLPHVTLTPGTALPPAPFPPSSPRHPPASPSANTRAAAFSAGRISTTHITAAAARANLAVLPRQNALMTAAHADPSRPVPILCAPRHQPAWIAVDPLTPTTHLDPP